MRRLTVGYGNPLQIVPDLLGRLLADPDPAEVVWVNQAMPGMVKLDTQTLRDAYDGIQ